MKALSILAHEMSREQIADLSDLSVTVTHLRDLSPALWARIAASPDNAPAIEDLACDVAEQLRIGGFCQLVGPGGSPAFMAEMTLACACRGTTMLFAHSERESAEQTQPDGSVRKVAVFRHRHWIPINTRRAA